jgi:outer membrane immunogenic protein
MKTLHIKKLSFPVVLLVALGATSSFATDLAAPPPAKPRPITKAPPIDPGYNWSGFYVGAHGGYAAGSSTSATFDPATYSTTLIRRDNFRLDEPTAPFGLSTASKGGFGGIQIGYNWQAAGSPWVFGIEADASFGRVRGEDAKPFAVVASFGGEGGASYTGVARLRRNIDAFGTVRSRIGYAADTMLVYATGGLALASIGTRFAVDSLAFPPRTDLNPEDIAALTSAGNASTKHVHVGYAVGGGVEWAFARSWSIKAEYVYLGFSRGGNTLVIPGGLASAARLDLQTVKGGVNYRF